MITIFLSEREGNAACKHASLALHSLPRTKNVLVLLQHNTQNTVIIVKQPDISHYEVDIIFKTDPLWQSQPVESSVAFIFFERRPREVKNFLLLSLIFKPNVVTFKDVGHLTCYPISLALYAALHRASLALR